MTCSRYWKNGKRFSFPRTKEAMQYKTFLPTRLVRKMKATRCSIRMTQIRIASILILLVVSLLVQECCAFYSIKTPIRYNYHQEQRYQKLFITTVDVDDDDDENDDGWDTKTTTAAAPTVMPSEVSQTSIIQNEQLQQLQQQRQQQKNRSTMNQNNKDNSDDDLFIPMFAIISISGFVGTYLYETIRLYNNGELYLPF